MRVTFKFPRSCDRAPRLLAGLDQKRDRDSDKAIIVSRIRDTEGGRRIVISMQHAIPKPPRTAVLSSPRDPNNPYIDENRYIAH